MLDAFRDRLGKALPAGLAVDRPAASACRKCRAVALVSGQPQRAGAGGAVHRRAAGLLDAGAGGRAAPGAVRAVARARRDAPAARHADRGRVGADRRGRQRARPRCRLRRSPISRCAGSASISARAIFAGSRRRLHADPVSLAVFFALGVAAAVLGSFVPALEAARAAPAPALKAGDEQRAFAAIATGLAGARRRLALGAAATTLPPVTGLPLFGYIAIALLLIGTLMLMPRLAVLVLSAVPAAARARAAAGAGAAARRAGAGRRQPGGDRREREPDGVDGDHGVVVPAFARRLAGARAAGRRLPSRERRRRHRVSSARRSGADRGAARRARVPSSCARRNCCSTRRGRAWRCSRARSTPTDSGAPPAAGRRVGDGCRRRAAADLGERSDRRSLRHAARCRGRAAARRQGGALHRGRRVPRLRATAGRDRDRPRSLRRADRRRHRDQRGALARAGGGRRTR